jgi:uncharacterized protein (TIGR02996 family)
MSQDAGFLQDIVAHPEDDTPRLIYADWLEDHGDPDRAAFIRVQCALARLDEIEVLQDAFPATSPVCRFAGLRR